MPQLAATEAYAWVVAAMAEAGVTSAAVTLAVAATAAALTYVAIGLAISYAVGKIASAIAGTSNTQPSPQTFMTRGTVYPRSIIYGATRSSGVAVYDYTRP